MLGRMALVVRHSRQIWELRLAGLADAASEVHMALVAETPELYRLPTPDAVLAEPAAAGQAETPSPVSQVAPPGSNPSAELLAELARIRDELTAERQARAEVDQQRRSDQPCRARPRPPRGGRVGADAAEAVYRRRASARRRAQHQLDPPVRLLPCLALQTEHAF